MSEPAKNPEFDATELLKKVNDLTEALHTERQRRERVEKAASVKAKWNSFTDDGKVDLDSVLWTLENYKPESAPKPNSIAAPPPAGGAARKINTPLGKLDPDKVDESMKAIIKGEKAQEDGF